MGAMAPYLIMGGLQAGGSLLSALFAPEGQEIESFDTPEGRAAGVDPMSAMISSKKMITDLGQMFNNYAEQPVSLPSSIVQGLPTITGGGLPMPIGVTGKDPARSNPQLVRKFLNGEIGSGNNSVHRVIPPDIWNRPRPPGTNPDDGGGWPRPIPVAITNSSGSSSTPAAATAQSSTSPVRRRGRDLMSADPGDDSQQAMAAVDLLLNGLGGG